MDDEKESNAELSWLWCGLYGPRLKDRYSQRRRRGIDDLFGEYRANVAAVRDALLTDLQQVNIEEDVRWNGSV